MTAIPLEEIEAAHARIKDHIRRTPFIRARFLKDPPVANEIILKLECLQVTGSFKPRGASNVALGLPEASDPVIRPFTGAGYSRRLRRNS